jgi:uncharacterized protein (TIGR02145 family)
MKKLSAFIAMIAIVISAYAQSPQKMNYQAVIRDSDNNLLKNTVVGMQISIIQGSADGATVYVETHAPETNSNGLITIVIGEGATSDDFSSIDWATGPYFLKTETDPTGGTNYTITGTSQLLSVPYAFHADYAHTANNADTATIADTAIHFLEIPTLADVIVKNDSANGQIKHLFDPTDENDAATKGYVDAFMKTFYQKGILEPIDLKDMGLSATYMFEFGVMVGTMEQIGIDSTELADAGLIGKVTDYEGNQYKWVRIGDQVWMAENLKATKFNDGTAIPLVTSDNSWEINWSSAYCWYHNDSARYADPYGALYNWYAIDTATNGGRNVCPSGWHVPSDAEWTELTDYLGGFEVAGGNLKETGTTQWFNPNAGATNESGFTAIPGGRRWDFGMFDFVFYYGEWWSSTANASSIALFRKLKYSTNDIQRTNSVKWSGFSV